MKKLLIVCGAGHATSTIAVAKVSAWLEKEGYSDKVKIYQSKIADELNKIDDYDAVISTTIVPDSIKDKVIQGLPLLNGMGVDQVYDQLKTRLGLIGADHGSFFGEVTLETVKGRASYHDISDEIRRKYQKI